MGVKVQAHKNILFSCSTGQELVPFDPLCAICPIRPLHPLCHFRPIKKLSRDFITVSNMPSALGLVLREGDKKKGESMVFYHTGGQVTAGIN